MIPLTWKHVSPESGATPDSDFVVAPDQRLGWARTIGIGAQHVVAMFGATFLVPVLTGFPPATTLLFSGGDRGVPRHAAAVAEKRTGSRAAVLVS